ncbi:MAG: aspartate/glutamate racemase family protein [Alphaproteobacteria bacterium]|nr:aspartate/glutamate racemase family protein [Alphaproteobacteria bacterium]
MPTRILIINPNSTAAMTAEIAEAASAFAHTGTSITAVNPPDGPASIQGPEDGKACLPGLFKLFDETLNDQTYDAVLIACFDDTGLFDLKKRVSIPVIGIGEAAFHAAAMLGRTFSTVTTLSVSIPVIENNIKAYGFADQSIRVRASEVPVLEVGQQTRQIIHAEARRACEEDKCDVIVLGCAGMAGLAQSLSTQLERPVVDGVSAGMGFCQTLANMHAA